ncbi:hypothetical protein NP493_149g02008 [Ridgeia piscesae]|uniref:GST C-terminal domain-containing protein n=1 Tax=Ridgeia piscesae TaxID=27915 RepID=A0AAD9UFZ1_RIDPI|nr:hypothetical protein NP493_149g02008 [Ridgeia piscesae]
MSSEDVDNMNNETASANGEASETSSPPNGVADEQLPPAEAEPEEQLPPPQTHETEEALENSEDTRPVVELFVKAAVDKFRNGGCPTCHRYFLIFFILRERGLVDLVVTTFLPESPPKEVKEFSNGKHFPLVKVHKGYDSNGQDMTGTECDTIDEIETLISRFDSEDMLDRRQSPKEAMAEKSSENLYNKFMQFLKSETADPTPLIRNLEKVDAHLRETDNTFMVTDHLTRADCYVLPTLQHIRVAGKYYKSFEIPTELTCLWRYLSNVYETDAFKESCPADREIITHYDSKVPASAKKLMLRSKLMGDQRTFSIPSEVNGC